MNSLSGAGVLLIVAIIAIVAGTIIYTSRHRRAWVIAAGSVAIIGFLLLRLLLPAPGSPQRGAKVVAAVDRAVTAETIHVATDEQAVMEDREAVMRDKAAVAAEQAGIEAQRDAQEPASEPASTDSVFHTIVTLAGMALLMGFVYVFLDAGRRAQYTWAIRAGSVVAFAVTCIVLSRLTSQL